ncbi:MAG: ribonuclease H-like domain-containing protein [Acidobacteriota bacterium]
MPEDIKEKLKRLKKEREARSKSQELRDAWSKLEQKEELSTKEKLEQLIQLRRDRKPRKNPEPRFEPHEREALQFTETPYSLDARYGKVKISQGLDIKGSTLACLSCDPEFEDKDLSTALFIDLETTGLSGGTGVVPFNVGMGYYRDGKFWVGQYFLGDLSEEERMIKELSQFFKDMKFESVVTYNGKAFDIPLLETRFVMHRTPFELSNLPHLDFLFPARSLWRHKYESCRLSYLAHEVVQTYRDEDIPSAEIPWRYFQYLQTGNYDLIEPILYHNAEDILSLLGVVIIGASIFSEGVEELTPDSMDFFGAGKVMERLGNGKEAARFFSKALEGKLTEEVGLSTRRRLSLQFKRNGEFENAVLLWEEMASINEPCYDLLFSLRELSMYYEHRRKEFDKALTYAEEGFVLSRGYSSRCEEDFIHRRERIKQKMKKQKKNKIKKEKKLK